MRYNERIKEQRKKLRYTQRQLADKINVSPQVISNWERGYTEPSSEDIKKLSAILDVSSDYLLGLSDDQTRNNFLLPANKTFDEHVDDLIDEIIDERSLEITESKREEVKSLVFKVNKLSKEDYDTFFQFLDILIKKDDRVK